MQVSTEGMGIPQKAIDASTSAFFNSETCTLTKVEKAPWWYVNLLEPYMVQLVRLDFGKACCGANKPATIVVRVGNNRPDLGTNPICNRFVGFLEEGQPLFLPCNPPMPGAFVSVHLEVTSPTQLSICEAFVYTDQALPIERCPQFRDQPPGNTATYNGKCYVFYNRQPTKFREALQFCRSRGGTLVDESNPALQGFISWELWRRHRSDSQGQYWMGAVRDKQNGGWQWLKGDEVTVSFWNLPVGNGDCARYDGTKGWLWSDTDCNMNLNYICQHQPKACGRPEQPPNSTMVAPNFNVGSTVEYACDEGHLLVGPQTRTCLETGFYNEFPPVCKRIQCGYPADIANGEYSLVNDSVGYLSRVIYSCYEGYEMIGRAQLACDIDERWNGPPPRCEPVQCEYPFEVENGFIDVPNNDTSYGSVISYDCSPGYRLLGPNKLTCMANGQYDSVPPVCEEDPALTSTTQEIIKITKPSSTTTTSTTTTTTSTTARTRSRTPKPPPTTIKAVNDVIRLTSRTRKPSPTISTGGTTERPLIVLADHPQDNEIAGSSNIQHGEVPNVNVPLPVDGDRREPFGARLNIGAIIALCAFGAFIFLAAVITTVVILVRSAGEPTRSSHRLPSPSNMPSRWYTLLALPFPDQQVGRREFCRSYRSHRAGNRSAKHYRHRASPDCNTVASFDSSSSGSRNGGLNRYYRQAWQNLHESAGTKAAAAAAAAVASAQSSPNNHSPLRRKETMDEPIRGREAVERQRDGSEMVVNDTYGAKGVERKRHHHHHHHHKEGREWNANRQPPGAHKRY
ncbi:hypothetical protein GWI33_000807 [Rhynchophorus ferrugineus]|uniref:Sushi, von Willebrand factor type A, EGF and pentraxin domain-containing protein 1 n=1 Tax=Rhynchophorus ferrugineus TaxID=354439 RepID=A0A834M3Q5_RHYFE|nr:hypothetical protein GWI33_000807 [Rhynchophorus ferrugineus]